MKFTHLIITKVNIKWFPQSKDEAWLNSRINIFNNALRPSIEAQTNKNFKFITLWGYEPVGKIDNEYQIIINSEGMPNIWREMMPKLLEFIDEENVLTTRIDTDNCLSYDFVENLHKHITDTEIPFYYDIKKMDMINLMTRTKRTWIGTNTSAFISVMEKKSDYKCIPYKTGHGRIQTFVNGIKFDDLNALCTLHGENIYIKNELGKLSDFDEKNKYGLKL